MNIIKTYLTSINTTIKKEMVDNYKIITINDKNYKRSFLIYDTNNITLNSQSLMKLLIIKSLPENALLQIINNKTTTLNNYMEKMKDISGLLYEDRIFFNFDPYGNFLLPNNAKSSDIQDIITKTTSYLNETTVEHDFSTMINPYGLEKVVFTGGGTKGIIYVGAIIGLLACGQIFYLNHFAGTSVGAMSAMVFGCITPSADTYEIIRNMSLREILISKSDLVCKYQEAINFITERFCKRNIETFYTLPTDTLFGWLSALNTIIKNNGLYDPQRCGFQVWYALICKKICFIMGNGLDELIVVKKKDGSLVDLLSTTETLDYDTDTYYGWELVKFFTFQEYYTHTHKTLVMTGTQTGRVSTTVYYTHTDQLYRNLSVVICATASMSIPWVFKAPVINDSYNLDGGIFDNYPITHCDRKVKDKITHYNNKIFGFLIDDKNSLIDAYEIIRELWIAYDSFIEIMNIGYLKDSENFAKISELFFEIRSEIYKLLYYTDIDLKTFVNRDVPEFNIKELADLFDILNCEELLLPEFGLPKKGIQFVQRNLKNLDTQYKNFESIFKVGKKTNLADVMELSVRQGEAYNTLSEQIEKELEIINSMSPETRLKFIDRYSDILKHLMKNILAYYELKGTFIKSNDLDCPSKYLMEIMKNLYRKVIEFERLTNEAVITINKKKPDVLMKNWISNGIQIIIAMVSKIMTRGTGYNIDIAQIDPNNNKYLYQKAIDYFFNTDMTGILYKYMCIANDRICNDSFNKMRTITLNTYETTVLHFNMDDELKGRMIYEGFSKTIKYFTNVLHVMEITGRVRASDEYLESFEIRFKKMV